MKKKNTTGLCRCKDGVGEGLNVAFAEGTTLHRSYSSEDNMDENNRRQM